MTRNCWSVATAACHPAAVAALQWNIANGTVQPTAAGWQWLQSAGGNATAARRSKAESARFGALRWAGHVKAVKIRRTRSEGALAGWEKRRLNVAASPIQQGQAQEEPDPAPDPCAP